MKKILFCAGVLALAASCTEDDLTSMAVQENQQKGIAFMGSLAESPATKGDFTTEDGKNYKFFWYAEQDRINVWGTYVKGANGVNATNQYISNKYATYKATQSAATGKFTGVSDADILEFEKTAAEVAEHPEYTSNFLALYPGKTTSGNGATLNEITSEGKYIIQGLPNLSNQTQSVAGSAKDLTQKMFMVSETTGSKTNDYDAVGEKINLNFSRQFTAMVFRTVGVDEYTDEGIFGNLKSIKVDMLGYDANGDGVANQTANGDILPSYIDYGQTNLYYQYDPAGKESKLLSYNGAASPGEEYVDFNTTYTNDAATSMTLTLGSGSGLAWHDADDAFLAINNVDRSKYTSGKKEKFNVTFSFANIDLTVPFETSSSWPLVKEGFVGPFNLNIDDFDYLVTKESNPGMSNDRALIVNSGSFSDVFDADGKVVWNGNTIDVTDFNTIVAKVELSDAELAKLKNFTNLASITLAENTEIPEGTFTQTTLKKIDFPKATVIEKDAFGTSVKLETVKLPAYKFEDEAIALQILDKNSLVELDMSGIDAMNVGFPSTGFTLDGYTSLETVTVKDGVKLGSNSFYGCEKLATVNGKVDINGSSVFNGCEELVTINIVNTDIKANAFNGCVKLENVLRDGKQVAPTSVGIGAFQKCEKLVNMDLSQIKETVTDENGTEIASIGDNAFKDCKLLIGGVENGKTIIKIGGKTIGASAFEGCDALVHVEFLHATTLGNNVLKVGSNPALKQIQLDKVVTFTNKNSNTTFGPSTVTVNVDLFITPGQQGVDGNELTLNSSATVEFKSIRDK